MILAALARPPVRIGWRSSRCEAHRVSMKTITYPQVRIFTGGQYMVTSTIRSCALTALATAALAVCGVARAQMIAASTRSEAPSSPPAALEEITVTARKRSESLIDVPVAVSAVPGEEGRRQGGAYLH